MKTCLFDLAHFLELKMFQSSVVEKLETRFRFNTFGTLLINEISIST
jgi:hypothetical protein